MYMYVYMCVYMYVYMYVYMCVYMYVYMCVSVCGRKLYCRAILTITVTLETNITKEAIMYENYKLY